MRFSPGIRIATLGTIALVLASQLGCDAAAALGIQPPDAGLNRVDLLKSPSVEQLAGYGCDQAGLGTYCSLIADLQTPKKSDLGFSFDLVFDLSNPNASIPIPMVQTLLGFTAFDTANLGSVCISFCDPDDASCQPTQDAVGACDVKGSKNVDEPADLIPSVDDPVALAEGVASGEGVGAIDNSDWRVVEPGSSTEVHLLFDLGIDPMLQIGDELVNEALDKILSGKALQLDVPYTVEGTLFFDAPQLNNYAIGFGPFADNWRIK